MFVIPLGNFIPEDFFSDAAPLRMWQALAILILKCCFGHLHCYLTKIYSIIEAESHIEVSKK